MKLKQQFNEFHEQIKTVYSNELKTKRTMFENEIKDSLPDILKEQGIEVKKSEIKFFLQGSCSNNTLVNTGGDVDLDLAVELPIDYQQFPDCRKIKGYVRDSVNSYNRTIKYKKPCITVDYKSYPLHIDLPVYSFYSNNYYLAVGEEFSDNYEWQKCDPKGLIEYFNEYLANNDQLRRIVRYLKKWKSMNFDDSNEMPPSIAMTILACKHFLNYTENGYDDDLTALYNLVKKIYNTIPYGDDPEFHVYLPKSPYSDTMFKINGNKSYRKKFKRKIGSFLANLENAKNSSDDYTAGLYLQKVFGEEFPLPEKKTESDENKYRRTGHFG